MNNPYSILGVAPESTLEEIEQAFQRAAFTCHPKNGGTPERFALVTGAYKAIIEDRQRNFVPVGAPAQTLSVGTKFSIPPKIREKPEQKISPLLTHKAIFASIVGGSMLLSGFVFNGLTVNLLSVVVGALGGFVAFLTYKSFVLGAAQSPQRPLLVAAAGGLLLWPLIAGVFVGALSLAAVVFLNRRAGWLVKI